MFGTLQLKSRPLKIGFLVDPKKINSIKKAIEINSTLWGGTYNPIIPVYKGTPRNWEKPFKSPSGEEIVKGYIEAFDPDILVQCTTSLPGYVRQLGLDIVQTYEVWEKGTNQNKEVYPKFGIGIFEILNHIYDEHFRYQEKNPPKIVIPKLPKNNSLFWASIFGILPKYISTIINSGYKKALEIETPKINLSKLDSELKGNMWFPRRITQYDLNFYKRSGFRNEDCLFFMDLTKNIDVIDYWNLRALGRNVIPIPIQLKDEPSIRKIATSFVTSVRKPMRYNPNIYNIATFICSKSLAMKDMEEFAKNLDIKKDPKDKSDEGFFSLQHWYPRIWNNWARNKDGAESDDIYHEEMEIDIRDVKESVHFKLVSPKFANSYYGAGGLKFSNEISFNLYGSDKIFAQVYPKSNGEHLNRLIGGIGIEHKEWRIGRNGLVKLVKYYERTENWTIPVAQDIFAAWMKDQGYEVKISTPGLIARQIFTQLDGSIQSLANIKLLELLEQMNRNNDEGQERHIGELKNRLGDNLYQYLLSKGIFRIGIKVQCPNCQRHSWFPINEIKDTLICPKCLNSFSSVGHIDKGKWCYKTAGPFSLPKYADGAYSVLLAMNFFDEHLHSVKVTTALSFEAKDNKSSVPLEADFGILWQESVFGEAKEGVIFGECKTFGDFEQKDYKKMTMLGKKFPGSILVFCTLKEELTLLEIKEITKIAKAGRKRMKNETPLNPVLILTRNELIDMFGPPTCWTKKYGGKYDRVYNLLEIADATQQIYLNLPSWHEDWQKEFEERRKRIQEKSLHKGNKNN